MAPSCEGGVQPRRVEQPPPVREVQVGRVGASQRMQRALGHVPYSGVSARSKRDAATARSAWSGGQMGTSDADNGAGNPTDWWDPEAGRRPSTFDIRAGAAQIATTATPGRQLQTGLKLSL